MDKWYWLFKMYTEFTQVLYNFAHKVFFDIGLNIKYFSKYFFGIKQIENNIAR